MTYIVLIRKDVESVYGVEFPDFPGCISAGETLDEALRSATEALGLHVRGLLDDGEELPAPSSLDSVLADSHSEGAVPSLVAIPSGKGRATRVNITLDENLLESVDRAAAERGMTRSGFLADAARHALR